MKGITFFEEDREPTPDKPNKIITGVVDENAEIYIKRLEQENKELKEELKNKPDTKWTLTTKDGKELTFIQSERIDMQEELNNTITKLFNQLKNKDSILTELEEYLVKITKNGANIEKITCSNILVYLKELKEKYKC